MDLLNQLKELAAIGGNKDGSVTRVSGSRDYELACDLLQKWMEEAGLTASIDKHGNVIGTLDGRNSDLPPIVLGSHIDTVVGGGKYDGAYGVLAALEVARRGPYNSPLVVAAFYDEENSMSGSKGYVSELEKDDLAMFIELHVEQGPVLDSQNVSIGVVTGIVGQRRMNVRFTGTANHAGTTPMDMRDDALVKAASFITYVNDLANESYDGLVATVGSASITPGGFSIIPSQVDLTCQVRDLEVETMDSFWQTLKEAFPEAEFETLHESEPCKCDDKVMMLVEFACMNLDFEYEVMPSRASHDAQNFGEICPVGMIFVPSVNGVSHGKDEHTKPEDLEKGCDVLWHAVKAFDNLG